MQYKLAVIGCPVEHSLSPKIHRHFAAVHGHDVKYDPLLAPHVFAQTADEFFDEGGFGCNVTVPYKLNAYEYVTELTPRAQLARSVNTIKLIGEKYGKRQFLGDNTDGYGLVYDLQRLNAPLKDGHVLILGAGGSCRGIVPCLADPALGLKAITIVNRSSVKGREIIDFLRANRQDLSPDLQLESIRYDNLDPFRDYNMIINTTSLSMENKLPPLHKDLTANCPFVYDLFYNREGDTIFTRSCRASGAASCHDGLGMLVGQAALAYELWTGVRPDIEKTLNYMRNYLING